jgi:hypothetical protein
VLSRGLVSGVPVVAAGLLTLYYNYVRFGNALDTGYLRDDTLALGSFWAGFAGLLFSPGRSVFIYSPALLAGVATLAAFGRRDRSTMWLLVGEFVIVFAFYSSLVNWDAERSYGPRYLLPVIPLLILPLAGCGSKSRLMTAVILVSVVVQLPGVLVDFSKVGAARVIGPRTETQRQWTWEAAGLSINTRASLAAVPENVSRLANGRRLPVRPGESGTRDFSDQFASSLDFWWVYLFYLGVVAGPVALAIGAGCAAAVAFLGWQVSESF